MGEPNPKKRKQGDGTEPEYAISVIDKNVPEPTKREKEISLKLQKLGLEFKKYLDDFTNGLIKEANERQNIILNARTKKSAIKELERRCVRTDMDYLFESDTENESMQVDVIVPQNQGTQQQPPILPGDSDSQNDILTDHNVSQNQGTQQQPPILPGDSDSQNDVQTGDNVLENQGTQQQPPILPNDSDSEDDVQTGDNVLENQYDRFSQIQIFGSDTAN